MNTGIIDNFLTVFTTYISSGFGLLGSEVGFLSSTLIAIDVTLAALFWTWGGDEDILQRLVRKTLYIGFFAFVIGNFSSLSTILFASFAGLGLKASGSSMALSTFMQPGAIAATGLTAAKPLVTATSDLLGFSAFFANIVTIAILLMAWLFVVLAFFILAVQVFITIIEFKLVTLAGFVLLPFAFFGRTAFMAERVLGHVVSSGIKLLVLAVITGIGTTLFTQFTSSTSGVIPTAEEAMSMVLAALSLLGLGIFAPGIANGIVSGGPQLGAGSAAGTTLLAGGTLAAGAAATRMTASTAASAIAGTSHGGARAAGAATMAYGLGSASKRGMAAVGSGLAAVGEAAASGATSPLRRASATIKTDFREGARSVIGAAGNGDPAAPAPSTPSAPPTWAAALRNRQTLSHGASIAAHTLRSGDGGGGGASIDLQNRD